MGASPIGLTKLKLSEIANWKRLALQHQEELHNLQRHEQSLLAISQKRSVRRPNFTTYTTPISPMQITIRVMQGTSFAQPYTKSTTLEPTCHCENLQQSLDSQISDCLHRVRKTRLATEVRIPHLCCLWIRSKQEKKTSEAEKVQTSNQTPIEASKLAGYLN
jgi:hypothetical protein